MGMLKTIKDLKNGDVISINTCRKTTSTQPLFYNDYIITTEMCNDKVLCVSLYDGSLKWLSKDTPQ